MSKKKSKVGKQKQKKAKSSITKKRKQIASKYNVPLLNTDNAGRQKNQNNKAGKQTKQQDGSNINSKNAGSMHSQIQTPFNSPKNASSLSSDTLMKGNDVVNSATIVNMNTTHSNKRKIIRKLKAKAQSVAMKKAAKKERKEFEKEYQSLHERTMYQQWKEQQQQRSNGKKNGTSSSCNSNDVSQSSIIQLAKPIFDIYRKPTTDELVSQTTNQLHKQNLIQQPQHNNQNCSNQESFMSTNATEITDNRTLLQQMAAKKREEMRMNQLYNNSNNNQQNNSVDDQEKFKNNSFWAFQDDDDEEDYNDRYETTATKQSKPTKAPSPFFQFAAPSFAVPAPSTITSVNQNQTVTSAVDDPDL